MDRVVATGSAAVGDAAPVGGTPQFFTEGNPAAPTPATVVPAYFLNSLMEEIRNVIVAAAITPAQGDYTQLLASLRALGRTKLTGNTSLYVATTGNDGNNGSSGSPYFTLQHAANVAQTAYDLNGYTLTIRVADGTYAGGAVLTNLPSGISSTGGVSFVGNTTTPGNCVISVANANCFTAQIGASYTISGFRLAATAGAGGVTGCGIVATLGSTIGLSTIEFGNCGTAHIYSANSAFVQTGVAAYAIVGNAPSHMLSTGGGGISITGATVTIGSARSFSTCFAQAAVNGFINADHLITTFTGAGVAGTTGQYYNANLGGIILTGGGATFFPGNVAGSTNGGSGQYA